MKHNDENTNMSSKYYKRKINKNENDRWKKRTTKQHGKWEVIKENALTGGTKQKKKEDEWK